MYSGQGFPASRVHASWETGIQQGMSMTPDIYYSRAGKGVGCPPGMDYEVYGPSLPMEHAFRSFFNFLCAFR
jgi:hypothetical protein